MRMFGSLIHNACDAFEQTGDLPDKTILVNIEEKSSEVIVRFYDNAGGIPPEILSRAFIPFFSAKDPALNIGTGLSSTYGIVKDFGGSIQVESTEGEGTKFTITLNKP